MGPFTLQGTDTLLSVLITFHLQSLPSFWTASALTSSTKCTCFKGSTHTSSQEPPLSIYIEYVWPIVASDSCPSAACTPTETWKSRPLPLTLIDSMLATLAGNSCPIQH